MLARPALIRTWILLAICALLVPGPARADEVPAGDPPLPEIIDEYDVGEITGSHVNLRVGPRVDNREVMQLNRGDVVLLVEQRGDWHGVRVPGGFHVAVSLDFVVREGPDVVRVDARNLNLRVHPPEEGQPAPGIFLDHPNPDDLLTLIRIVDPPTPPPPAEGESASAAAEPEWAWVIAPESVRAFVHKRYVKRLGPASEHRELVKAARAARQAEAKRLSTLRRREAARQAGTELREVVSAVQQALKGLRRDGGTDKTPVVELANQLDGALERATTASEAAVRIARALREDLEREIALRVARHDAELAKVQGLNPPAVPPLAPVVENFATAGEIRYEPTPGWEQDGIHLLWIDKKPRFALRLTVGGPLPHPDFAKHAGAGSRHLEGRLSGDRLFGFPVFEVRALKLPE